MPPLKKLIVEEVFEGSFEKKLIKNKNVLSKKVSNDSPKDEKNFQKNVGEEKIITLLNIDEDNYSREWTIDGIPSFIKQNKSVWLTPLKLSNKITIFKIDTGASVTVIPLSVYESLDLNEMRKTDTRIYGASGHALDVVGEITTTISRLGSNMSVLCNVSVIKGLHQSLLGLQEITALNLVILNLDDKDEATTETIEKKHENKDTIIETNPKSMIRKTQCWQDEFLPPCVGLGRVSYFSSHLPFSAMIWFSGTVDPDNPFHEGMIKNPRRRKNKQKHQANSQTENNNESKLLTQLLNDFMPIHETRLFNRHGPINSNWSRHY